MSAFKTSGHAPDTQPRLILLAEDHPLNQKVAMLLLEKMGFDVHVVASGAQAVYRATRCSYDAILMDCHMPEVDGFEATRQIRNNPDSINRHVPIIAVTALAMAGDRERCLRSGMNDYVSKPIDSEVLRRKLVYWMNPGTVSDLGASGNVVAMFDAAHCDFREEAVNTTHLFDAYGEDAPQLLQLFLSTSERILSDLELSIQEDNLGQVASLAHELKGASWAVGAEELARLSLFLEQAAGQQNGRIVNRTLLRLKHQFGDVKQFLLVKLSLNESAAEDRH